MTDFFVHYDLPLGGITITCDGSLTRYADGVERK